MSHLILSPRAIDDSERLAAAATDRGWTVQRLTGWRLPADTALPPTLALYGEPLFARIVAAQANRVLLEPPHDWLTHLPTTFTRRHITLTPLGDLHTLTFPRFLKPPDDKLFPAQLYRSAQALTTARPDLDPAQPVLTSDPVHFASEFRLHMHHGHAVSCSRYLQDGHLSPSNTDPDCAEAIRFGEELASAATAFTPPAVVIDVGRLDHSRCHRPRL
ncbi:MAG: ATP-grasp domain-containing protein, partial [Myxococcota bacterium]